MFNTHLYTLTSVTEQTLAIHPLFHYRVNGVLSWAQKSTFEYMHLSVYWTGLLSRELCAYYKDAVDPIMICMIMFKMYLHGYSRDIAFSILNIECPQTVGIFATNPFFLSATYKWDCPGDLQEKKLRRTVWSRERRPAWDRWCIPHNSRPCCYSLWFHLCGLT